MNLETKLKKWTLAKWKKKFWDKFAEYTKLRDKNICFTCGRKVYGSEAHAGHFRPAGACGLALYFHEVNVKCQCYRCNINLQGNQYEFGKRLGEERIKELDEYSKRNKNLKYEKMDYYDLIEVYKCKIENL